MAGPPTPRGRVLMLAYHFPPLGGAGVQRLTQLARRLPALGWEPIVVTGPGEPESHWRPRDESVVADDLHVAVHRLPPPEPPHDVRWEARLERWLRLPQRWQRWWSRHVREVSDSVGGHVDLVHASLAPYSTADAAVAVARRLGKPLLVDLEDPWALDEMLVYPTRVHRGLERRRMGRILGGADSVVMNTPEARRRVLVTFGLSPDSVVAIPNAFDPADFAIAEQTSLLGAGTSRFRIVHTGSLHTELGERHRAAGGLRRLLGGAEPGVDFLSRSHVFLLQAIESLQAREPGLADVIEVHLAGAFTAEDRAVASDRPYVTLHEFVSHRETVALLKAADLLFLPMHDLPPGVRAGLVPHKTYEYLAAARPILGAVPDGEARDLLAASGAARLTRPADVDAMAAAIREEVARWRSGAAPPVPDAEVVARCTAERLAADFAGVYASLRGSRPS